MRPWCWLCTLLCALAAVAVAGPLLAQGPDRHDEVVIVPDSSRERPGDIGRRAHTNHLILRLPEKRSYQPAGLTPAVIRAAYGLPPYSHFTAPDVVYFAASGDTGGKTIWPGVSPNCVSAGGTTLNVSSSGSFVSWQLRHWHVR